MAEEKSTEGAEPRDPKWLTNFLRLEHEDRKSQALRLSREVLQLQESIAARKAELEEMRAAAVLRNGVHTRS